MDVDSVLLYITVFILIFFSPVYYKPYKGPNKKTTTNKRTN